MQPSKGRVGPVAQNGCGVGVLNSGISHANGDEWNGAGSKAPRRDVVLLWVRRQLGWRIRPDLDVMGQRGMRYVGVLSANCRGHRRCRRGACGEWGRSAWRRRLGGVAMGRCRDSVEDPPGIIIESGWAGPGATTCAGVGVEDRRWWAWLGGGGESGPLRVR
jgi:hypothetical protein